MTQHLPRGVVPTLLLSGVVVLVALGLARGFWLENLHNALLALAFTGVGTYVLIQRPGHREGVLFAATGVVEAVMFFGRQVGHTPSAGTSPWWAWWGVWPLAVALALTTLSVVLYPDGRFPAPLWRWVAGVVVLVAVICSSLSATSPTIYSRRFGRLGTDPRSNARELMPCESLAPERRARIAAEAVELTSASLERANAPSVVLGAIPDVAWVLRRRVSVLLRTRRR